MAETDSLHLRVEQYMREHPSVLQRHKIMRVSRKKPGEYDVDGRTVKIQWDAGQETLMVIDGPLVQPIGAYMKKGESNAMFSTEGLKNSNLNMLPKDARVTFQDPGVGYSRLDAMKVAKEQARFRERAADYAKAGQTVPQDLIDRYEKTIDIKLGKRWSKENRSREVELPQPAPGAPQGSAPAPAWWPAVAAPVNAQPVAQMTQPATLEVAMPVAAMGARPAIAPTAVFASQAPQAGAPIAQPVDEVGYDRAELMRTMFVKRGDAQAKQPTPGPPQPTAMFANVPNTVIAQVPKAAPLQPTALPASPTKLVATAGVPSMVMKPPQVIKAADIQQKPTSPDVGSRYGSRPGNIYGQLAVPDQKMAIPGGA